MTDVAFDQTRGCLFSFILGIFTCPTAMGIVKSGKSTMMRNCEDVKE